MLKSFKTLEYNFSGLPLTVGLSILQKHVSFVEQFSTCAQIHDQVKITLVILCLVVINIVWVVNLSKRIDFDQNLIHLDLSQLISINHFNCDMKIRITQISNKMEVSF